MASRIESDLAYVEFVGASMRDLRRTAYLLCGDWDRADDAVQEALIKVYVRFDKLVVRNTLWSYVRRAVVNAVTDQGRWLRRRPEVSLPELPDVPLGDGTGTIDDRLLLRQALDALPARQRAVVILRFVDDLDVSETAGVLRLPEGTVTSSTARALTFLRKFLVKAGLVRGTPAVGTPLSRTGDVESSRRSAAMGLGQASS